MKQVATQAIVLSRIDFGESGRILTLLTSSHGKVGAIAKGVRKPKSKLAGGVELFTVADIVFMEGKSDIKTLVSAQLKQNFSHISQDITRSMMAYDILKFTNLYTESVCEDSYFTLVYTVFAGLDELSFDPRLVWAWFCVRLLEISGHSLNLVTDKNGEKMNAADHFMFDYQDMAFYSHPNGSYTSSHIKLLRLCERAGLDKLMDVQGATDAAQDLQQLLNECIKIQSH